MVDDPLVEVEITNDTGAPLPVSGPLTDTELRAVAVPVSGPLTDVQLRAVPVPVSGTVTTGGLTDTQLRASPVSILATAGSSIIGKVGIDQTTPGTTNGVQVTAALPAGSNVIGHVITDTGSTTVVTGTVTANATLSAETTKVIGTVNVSAGQTIAVTNVGTFAVQAAQSGTWTVQPGNTANTTAWKVDGSAVTQPVSGTVAATQSGSWSVSVVSSGTAIDDYNTSASLAANGTSNHDYTVTGGKTLSLYSVHASASGKLKIEVQIETGAFATKFVGFNSVSNPNIDIMFKDSPISVAAAKRVRIIRTNMDNQAQDVYSTISGVEN